LQDPGAGRGPYQGIRHAGQPPGRHRLPVLQHGQRRQARLIHDPFKHIIVYN